MLNNALKKNINILIVDDIEYNIMGLTLILSQVEKIKQIYKANTGI